MGEIKPNSSTSARSIAVAVASPPPATVPRLRDHHDEANELLEAPPGPLDAQIVHNAPHGLAVAGVANRHPRGNG